MDNQLNIPHIFYVRGDYVSFCFDEILVRMRTAINGLIPCLMLLASMACRPSVTLHEEAIYVGRTGSPVSIKPEINNVHRVAAMEGRLGLRDRAGEDELPVEWEVHPEGGILEGTTILTGELKAGQAYDLSVRDMAFAPLMSARREAETGQILIEEEGQSVLRYNYETVYETDQYAFAGMAANEYEKMPTDTFMSNPSIYAVPRSNYIHPLFGLHDEILTRDWSRDHPHHRGIYWAWPEVDFEERRGDLHALQQVFARPTGRVRMQGGPVYAEVEAENLWLWEEGMVPVVRETALIRAYRKTDNIRIIDLAFHFIGVRPGISIARRGTDAYGGLNIRMMTPTDQEIRFFIEGADTEVRRAWSVLSGGFEDGKGTSGLIVLQHPANPDYPGEWIEYPDLSWVQPTFPATGTRFALEPGQPLILRFRLVVFSGEVPDDAAKARLWDAYASPKAPEPRFSLM